MMIKVPEIKTEYCGVYDILGLLEAKRIEAADELSAANHENWQRRERVEVSARYDMLTELIDEITKKPATEATDADLDK